MPDASAQGYDLSLNRYDGFVHRPPGELFGALEGLEKEIVLGIKDLEEMLK